MTLETIAVYCVIAFAVFIIVGIWIFYDRLYRAIVRAIRRHLRPEVEECYSRRFNDSNVEYSKRTYQ